MFAIGMCLLIIGFIGYHATGADRLNDAFSFTALIGLIMMGASLAVFTWRFLP